MYHKRKIYHVERKHSQLGWRKIPFAEGTQGYCRGWVDCSDSHYPSLPLRIVVTFADGSTEIVKETKGRGKVHTN